ncbi:helix-turn-helix transcriptional regulator [Coleofasciculus sp. LEGE 07081]|uniref:helix-turn-helix domain-containing protein n=1 Tax=Coleofasciculus sp. LEGE 07081 TaxID=2777967 RepID=UPI0018812058|nr:helix-turn-helix transcriptional regulator [Coleofasciculus sp. LEGE 07081]MBE9128318.1 helix-turn-helix transcriptional regulator [Coleofasciculus sp. LEGE 07081]
MRAAREKAGLSQRELSKKLGQQSTYVYKLEAGIIRRIDIVEIIRFADAIGITLNDLIS